MIDYPPAIPQTAKRSSFDRRSTNEMPYASGHGSASRHRSLCCYSRSQFSPLFSLRSSLCGQLSGCRLSTRRAVRDSLVNIHQQGDVS